MTSRKLGRRPFAVAGLLAVALTASACGDDDTTPTAGATPTGTGGSSSAATGDDPCAAFSAFGDIKGKTVTLYTGIVTPESEKLEEAWEPFEECTGATIKGEFDKAFETQILVRAKAGNPPDIAIVPQPGLLQQLVTTGSAKAAPAETVANVDKFWSKDWKGYGTVNGTFYAAPLGANLKSLVWFSPSAFSDGGYTVPTTLDEMYSLSEKMAADGKKPWCAGIASGEATGWPITDWMEDMMLRLSGPEEFDKWVKHEIAFNSEGPKAALDEVGRYLKDPRFVNGGLGDVKSIASTTFQDGGLPILDSTCYMHRQANFYTANWPKGTKVAADGDVFAFFMPGKDASSKPALGGGEFTLAFSDRPEVKAFQTYLASDVYATNKAAGGGTVITANKGLDVSKCTCTDIDKLALEVLADENAVFRFDGSDAMPAAIGSNAFWKQATSWITGQSTQESVDKIEAAWPK